MVLHLFEGLDQIKKGLGITVELLGGKLGLEGSLPSSPLRTHTKSSIHLRPEIVALPSPGNTRPCPHPHSYHGGE